MPLAGLFGKEKERQGPSSSNEKDIRGSVIKLPGNTVTLERKLAEGGFAIVYLASDKNGRQYALKRQFVSEDERQVQACKRECQIISSLSSHKNIVSYVDHMITQGRDGVYDYMLLTAYYRTSVLALMNERLMSSRCLSAKEVLSIFCDMCEAVARLHHSQTPVIHRDLKVENILIDDYKRDSPVFVLCDFGSATTKVLSTETHPHALVEEEVLKYTTLSYRAPEMIDLYAGRPIGTKSDVWALGVMLYKLCYFALPFGESALAIQNGSFTFPSEPDYPEELRGLLKFLLEPDLDLRPDIYQTSSIAFQLAGKRCPVANLHKVPTPTVADVVQLLRGGDRRALPERTASPKGSVERTSAYNSSSAAASVTPVLGERVAPSTTTTTVNPRLRPKASANVVRVPLGGTPTPVPAAPEPAPHSLSNPDLAAVASVAAPPPSPARSVGNRAQPTKAAVPSSSVEPSIARPHPVRPQDLGFRDLEEPTVVSATVLNPFTDVSPFRSAEPPEAPLVSLSPPDQHRQPRLEDLVGGSAPHLPVISPLRHANPIDDFHQHHRRNVSDTSAVEPSLRSSAFKPYRTSQPENVAKAEYRDVEADRIRQSESTSPPPVKLDLKSETVSWNPFTSAPYGDEPDQVRHHGMDDQSFGERFDELPRIQQRTGSLSSTSNVKSRESLVMAIDEKDPFGAAPFDPLQRSARIRQQQNPSAGMPEVAREAREQGDYNALRPPSRNEWEDADSVGSASDLRQRMQTVSTTEDDSDDEDRVGRRRFSYEHFGGVGDDTSSNSKAADDDDDDSVDDGTKDASSSALASSHTPDLTGDETGSRPLLDDDELDDEGVVRHATSASAIAHPSASYHLSAAHHVELVQLESKTATASIYTASARSHVPTANMEDEFTISPPYVTPSETPIADATSTTTPVSRSSIFFGASTVPPAPPKHQSIPVARPLVAGSTSAASSTTTLISTDPFNCAPLPAHPVSMKPKPPPKPKLSPLLRKKRSSSGSSASSDSPETDDSGAEICSKKASGAGGSSGKRKGHARSMRGEEDSSVAVAAPSTVPAASPMMASAARKKSSGKWTAAKSGGSSVLDAASFVNSSFQSEDVEGGSSPRQQVLQHS